MHTIVYAWRVPMDAMSMSCSSLNTVARVPETDGSILAGHVLKPSSGGCVLPAKTPHITVDINGVLVVSLIFDKMLKSSPSLAIAYKIRGSGNIAPKRLYTHTHTFIYETVRMRSVRRTRHRDVVHDEHVPRAQREYRSSGDNDLDYRHSEVFVESRERRVRILKVYERTVNVSPRRVRRANGVFKTYLWIVRPHERENGGHAAIGYRAEEQRRDDRQRYVPFGIFRLLACRANANNKLILRAGGVGRGRGNRTDRSSRSNRNRWSRKNISRLLLQRRPIRTARTLLRRRALRRVFRFSVSTNWNSSLNACTEKY